MAQVLEQQGVVYLNKAYTDRLWVMEIDVDQIGQQVLPGQFIHVKIPGMEGHILRRPFSVYYTCEEGARIGVLYQVVGFGSAHMTTLEPGETLSVMGPIGHGWSIPENTSSALLVAGGVGGAPLLMHAQELVAQGVDVDVVLGAQSADALVVEPRYAQLLGRDPMIATDDGSRGHAGFCTDLVAHKIAERSYDYVACCGPEPMMKIVSEMTLAAGIPTWISLEKRMACGIGACLSCIVETTAGRKRSCIDGPIFDASEVLW